MSRKRTSSGFISWANASVAVSGVAALTVQAWVLIDSFSFTKFPLFAVDNGFPGCQFQLVVGDVTAKRLRFKVSNGATIYSTSEDTADLVTGQFYHVMGVYDGATVKCYKDLVEVGTATAVGGNLYANTGLTLGTIFVTAYSSGTALQVGHMYGLAAWNIALDSTQRAAAKAASDPSTVATANCRFNAKLLQSAAGNNDDTIGPYAATTTPTLTDTADPTFAAGGGGSAAVRRRYIMEAYN